MSRKPAPPDPERRPDGHLLRRPPPVEGELENKIKLLKTEYKKLTEQFAALKKNYEDANQERDQLRTDCAAHSQATAALTEECTTLTNNLSTYQSQFFQSIAEVREAQEILRLEEIEAAHRTPPPPLFSPEVLAPVQELEDLFQKEMAALNVHLQIEQNKSKQLEGEVQLMAKDRENLEEEHKTAMLVLEQLLQNYQASVESYKKQEQTLLDQLHREPVILEAEDAAAPDAEPVGGWELIDDRTN